MQYSLDNLPDRNAIPLYLKQKGYNGTGIEVGVAGGHYSEVLLEHSDLSRLFSVDPWSLSEANENWLSDPSLYLESVKRLTKFGLRSVVLRMMSVDAAKLFADNSLDFVYIDGWHWHVGINADISAWYPKVKSGGIFSGHDYCAYHPDVIVAVDRLCVDESLTLHKTECDFIHEGHAIKSWLVEKP
jgi:hypothetical protein